MDETQLEEIELKITWRTFTIDHAKKLITALRTAWAERDEAWQEIRAVYGPGDETIRGAKRGIIAEWKNRVVRAEAEVKQLANELDYAKSAPTYYAQYVTNLETVRTATEAFVTWHDSPEQTEGCDGLIRDMRCALQGGIDTTAQPFSRHAESYDPTLNRKP